MYALGLNDKSYLLLAHLVNYGSLFNVEVIGLCDVGERDGEQQHEWSHARAQDRARDAKKKGERSQEAGGQGGQD